MISIELTAVSPIDGRYKNKCSQLSEYFSEYALFKYRVQVEVEYFIELTRIPLAPLANFPKEHEEKLRDLYRNFTTEDAAAIKEFEAVTNHDIKAVEYFIKKKLDESGLSDVKEFVHFGLTSQDINNTAIPLSLKEGTLDVILPELVKTHEKIVSLSEEWENVPMLARTHGQPASPTRLGKEIYVFAERLKLQIDMLKEIPYAAKFGGATGNFNAHHVAYPEMNWRDFGNSFVNNTLGLHRSQTTTQIEHYDYFAAYCDSIKRINNILLDLNRDMWTYISMDYFKQKIKKNEVGSSAMPHKVNPIDFENSEGNIGIANALFEHLAAKLPVSRLQRDLTDSTVLRNIGTPLAHTLIALKSTQKGLGKLVLNENEIQRDLENNFAVVAEAVQTILRREQYPNPYEALKDLTRTHTRITPESLAEFVSNLEVSDKVKTEIKAITPFNYTGLKHKK